MTPELLDARRAPRVLIVEDDRSLALDLKNMLVEFGFTPCAVAHSAREALRDARAFQAELVLMDICLEGSLEGIFAAQLLWQELGLRVVYLTAIFDASTLALAQQTQPYGYVLKPVRPLDLRWCLELALHQSRNDGTRVPPPSAQSHLSSVPPQANPPSALEMLSARELEVLTMTTRGYTSKDIAKKLGIAKATVDTYRARVIEKLGAKSRAELVSIAARAGLLLASD
jgi:DNA-binding NarL/FixJ family response regulator